MTDKECYAHGTLPLAQLLKLCEHGNYHCMICEVKLLKLVIAEQAADIKRLREALEWYAEAWGNANIGDRARTALSSIGGKK